MSYLKTNIVPLFCILLVSIGFIFRENQYSAIVVTLLWMGLIVIDTRFNETTQTALSISNTTSLRGWAAIEIMLGHIASKTGSIIQFPNRKAGILFVGVFFLLSGYGLMYGLDKKENYLKGFIKIRFLRIILPVLIITALALLLTNNVSIIKLFTSINWYVYELLFLYLIFFISFSICSSQEIGIILTSIISFILVCVCFAAKVINPWYGSTLCFPLGMIYYKYNYISRKLTTAKRILALAVIGIMFSASIYGFFVLDGTFLGNVIFRNAASLLFCGALVIALEKLKLDNKLSTFLGSISFEIYLIHGWINEVFSQIFSMSAFSFSIVVIVVSVIISFLAHKIIKRLFLIIHL